MTDDHEQAAASQGADGTAEGTPIDVSRTIGELRAAHPELADVLAQIGLDDAPEDLTLPQVAAQAEVDMGVIAFVLESSGFVVENFSREPGTAFASPLPDIIGHFFGEDDPDEPSREALSAATPTLAKLERAVKRAQREGRLPSDEELGATQAAGEGDAS